MAKYLITGGTRLEGTIEVSGNKNAVFPCMAAALLTADEVVLHNMPQISDVGVMVDILKSLGARVQVDNHTITIQADNLTSTQIPNDLARKLRGSVVLVGAILARKGVVEFAHPGGDIIGKRSIGPHLKALEEVGYKFKVEDLNYQGFKEGELTTASVFLEEASVTACENLILSLALGNHTVTIKNCPKEPHVVDLCNMLNQMGAKIEGVGNTTLTITGVEKLNGVGFSLGQDYIEIGTYAIAAAVTKGSITISNCNLTDLEPITLPLHKVGVHISEDENGITFSATKLEAIARLHTNLWPGFPTDLMSPFITLVTQADGQSLLHDWMYESRMFFVDKLISMGANITIADPHRVIVDGPTKLYARDLETPDIRAGMALLLAALIAQGQSTIHKAELIERGYENVVEKLTSLGAKIERIN